MDAFQSDNVTKQQQQQKELRFSRSFSMPEKEICFFLFFFFSHPIIYGKVFVPGAHQNVTFRGFFEEVIRFCLFVCFLFQDLFVFLALEGFTVGFFALLFLCVVFIKKKKTRFNIISCLSSDSTLNPCFIIPDIPAKVHM